MRLGLLPRVAQDHVERAVDEGVAAFEQQPAVDVGFAAERDRLTAAADEFFAERQIGRGQPQDIRLRRDVLAEGFRRVCLARVALGKRRMEYARKELEP